MIKYRIDDAGKLCGWIQALNGVTLDDETRYVSIEPPPVPPGYVSVWDGVAWELVEEEGAPVMLAAEPPGALPPVDLVAAYTAALDRFLDAQAQTRQYDNRVTCAMRAGYPGPYQAEGIAYGTWMDQCYQIETGVLNAVRAGTQPMPTISEMLAMMPAFAWPEAGQ